MAGGSPRPLDVRVDARDSEHTDVFFVAAVLVSSIYNKISWEEGKLDDPALFGYQNAPSEHRLRADHARSPSRDPTRPLVRSLQYSPKVGRIAHAPDYTKDVTVVLREVFCSLTTRDVSLVRLLADAGRLGTGSPTWVPDFNTTAGCADARHLDGTHPKSATRGSNPLATFPNDDGRTLVVQGTVIDTVAYCAKEMKEPPPPSGGNGGNGEDLLSHNLNTFLEWLSIAWSRAIVLGTLGDAVYNIIGGGGRRRPGGRDPRAEFSLFYQLIGQASNSWEIGRSRDPRGG